MYLKDCTVLYDDGNESKQFFAHWVLKKRGRISCFNAEMKCTHSLSMDWPCMAREFNGIEVKERDYRLAIARALSQKALQHEEKT